MAEIGIALAIVLTFVALKDERSEMAAPFESAWRDLGIGVDLVLRRQYLFIVLPRFHLSPIR